MQPFGGTLKYRAEDQNLSFESQDGSVSFYGPIDKKLSEDFERPAVVNFDKVAGPYVVQGIIGDHGIHLQLSGPVGQGTIAAPPVGFPGDQVRGNIIVEVK